MQWLARGRKNEERGCDGRANGLQSMARGLRLAGRLAPGGWPAQFFFDVVLGSLTIFFVSQIKKKEKCFDFSRWAPNGTSCRPRRSGRWATATWAIFFWFSFSIYMGMHQFFHIQKIHFSTMYYFSGQKIICLKSIIIKFIVL